MCCCNATGWHSPLLAAAPAASSFTTAKTQLDVVRQSDFEAHAEAPICRFSLLGGVELLRRSRFVRIPARPAMRQAPQIRPCSGALHGIHRATQLTANHAGPDRVHRLHGSAKDARGGARNPTHLGDEVSLYLGSEGGAFSRPNIRLEIHTPWHSCLSSRLDAAELVGRV